jgi:hypothetical protein
VVEHDMTIMVDVTLPSISISTPTNNTIYSVDSVDITWSGSDLGSGIDHYEVGIDNAIMTDVGKATSWTALDLGEGTHTIKVMAVDTSGKVRLAYIIVVIDTIAPMIGITTPTTGGLYPSAQVNVTWTSMEIGSGLASYYVKVDDGTWLSTAANAFAVLQLAEGAHNIMVKAVDLAGNLGYAFVNITVDLDPPVIHSILPLDGSLVDSATVVFEWVVSDSIGVASLSYSMDNEMGHTLTAGTTSLSVTLQAGIHLFKLTVIDRVGHETVGYVNLTVDDIAPTVIEHTPASPNAAISDRITFRFSEDVNGTGMMVLVNGQQTSYEQNGTAYYVGMTFVAGTTYTIMVQGAKDMVGNAMEAYTWSFTVVSGEQLPGQVVVSGTVVDQNGRPVSGALVRMNVQSTTTNALGQFSLYVDLGSQQLLVTASGMSEVQQNVNVVSDQQLGQIMLTATVQNSEQTGSSGGDMNIYLVIGVMAIVGVLGAVVYLRKR